ncbi:hypothetical protein [Microbacterium sp. NPDC089695]|uniref:hypothetical protein n=1 Tax=Microbacterium sp. NPDC089695 TaxID=3364198 RepID=UPI003822B35E
MSANRRSSESLVTFDEAHQHSESQQRRVKAYLNKSINAGRVAEVELAEITRISAAYAARLGNQPDPWQQFQDLQSRLSRLAL